MERSSSEGSPGDRRQRVIDALREAFARDQLDVDELERRLDETYRARTEGEFLRALDGLDLKALEAPIRALPPDDTGATTGLGFPAPLPGSRIARVDSSQVPERQFSLAIWSGRSRKGSWIPAKKMSAIAVQGGIELDFREARFGPGVTEVRAIAVMGAVEITVPPDLHVETSGFAFMGAVEDDVDAAGVVPHQGPVLRVSGFALMGAVEVKVRLPGETDRDARTRKRQERRELKERRREGI